MLGSYIIGDKLKKLLDDGTIVVSPYSPQYVGPASVDLTLSHEFRRFSISAHAIDITSETDYRDHTYRCDVKEDGSEGFVVQPGELILGITREAVSIPKNICGILEGRSRFARVGVLVHVTAGLMQPGLQNNRTVLEIINFGHRPIVLYPGVPICQFSFLNCDGEASYSGSWASQQL